MKPFGPFLDLISDCFHDRGRPQAWVAVIFGVPTWDAGDDDGLRLFVAFIIAGGCIRLDGNIAVYYHVIDVAMEDGLATVEVFACPVDVWRFRDCS